MGETKQPDRDNNMKIWDAVSITDPRHTKKVEFGRKFTAIDAHYQVQSATTQFGPVGAGWGYKTKFSEIFLENGQIMVCCDLTLWWRSEAEWENIPMKSPKREFGPIRGAAMLYNGKKVDTDAPKKAMTDALTKWLSHMGFSADVFLGKFDDNKYVNQLKKDVEAEESASVKEYEQTKAKLVKQVQESKTKDQIDAILADFDMWINRQSPGRAAEIRAWCEKQKEKLK